MININGKIYQGNKVSIINNKVYIDGKLQEENPSGVLEIKIEGKIDKLECDGSVEMKGEVGSISAGGSITCGDVKGNVTAGGNISCGVVAGKTIAGGSLNIGSGNKNIFNNVFGSKFPF